MEQKILTKHDNEKLLINKNQKIKSKTLSFSVKIGKSDRNKGWSINRENLEYLLPKLDYEDECDIIIDGISAKARLNINPRIFYEQKPEIVNHLTELRKKDPNGRINIDLILNKEENDSDFNKEITLLKNKVESLQKEIDLDFNKEIRILKNKVESLQKEIENLKLKY